MSKDFPEKLPEKLRRIREGTGLTPKEFASHVKAKDGATVVAYESGEGDMPVSVLLAYWKLIGLPLENLVEDERDLWSGHLSPPTH